MHLLNRILPRIAALIGFPSGVGVMIDGPTRKRLVLSAALSCLLAFLDMAGVVAMLPMMQYVTGQPRDRGALGMVTDSLDDPPVQVLVGALALIIVVAFIVKDVAALFVRRWQLTFMSRQQVHISTSLLESYLTGPYAWHLRANTSEKLWTINGAASMGYAGGLTSALAALTEVLTIGFIFVSLLVISPTASVAAAIYLGAAAFVVQRFIRPRVQSAGRRAQEAAQGMSKASLQPLTAVKEIKLRNAHGPFVEEFRKASLEGADAGVVASILNDIPKYFLEIVFVTGVGLLAVSTAGGTVGNGLVLLGLFVAAGTRIVPSAVRLINAMSGIRFAQSPLAHIVHVHNELTTDRAATLARVVTEEIPRGDIKVRGVRFAYSDDLESEVLRGVDLDIRSGTSMAVVGTSGAGKSTLVDLILGLQVPTAGSISAGGLSIFDNLQGWQRQVAVVPQDVTLLDATIRENIAFDEEVNEERMALVVERAQLKDLLAGIPGGLDSIAGERGMRLSGGQRQRIGIARALYRDPALLVLDEATSALDNETERRLTETIESLKGSMTMVIVAHRLSTIRHCDALAFMEHGQVVNVGTFDEVRRDNQEFAHLVSLGALLSEHPA